MTESTKLLIAAVEQAGEKVVNHNTLIISYDEGDDVASIYHDNMMWGAGKIALKEIDEKELREDGVKIWRTWNWGDK